MKAKNKELLFSVTKDDCDWQFFRGPGNGGQKKNKTSSACRCVHKPSGAVGECSEHRSQLQNKQAAFAKMGKSLDFKRWVYGKIAEMDTKKTIEERVDDMMKVENLKIEVKEDGKWVDEKWTKKCACGYEIPDDADSCSECACEDDGV